jgi:hypothetical protein
MSGAIGTRVAGSARRESERRASSVAEDICRESERRGGLAAAHRNQHEGA